MTGLSDNGFIAACLGVNKIVNEIDSKESINHPLHYNKGKIEVIDFIEDQQLGFNLGNAVKYICRAGGKENDIEDLKKALWYLQRELSRRDGTLITTTEINYGGSEVL